MSYKVDDPLAGILSDGSDDSFFDDDILGKKKPTKAKSTPTEEKKSSLLDLGGSVKLLDKPTTILDGKKDTAFDFDKAFADEPNPELSSKTVASKDSINFQSTEPRKAVIDVSKSPAKSIGKTSTDKLDFLNETTKEVTPLAKGKSSQSLLDDILGAPTSKVKDSNQSRPVTAAKSDFDLDSFLGKNETKPASSTKNTKNEITKVEKPKVDPPPSKKKSSENWLGLFQEEDDVDSGMPSWLGGGDTKMKQKEKPSEKRPISKEEIKQQVIEEQPRNVEREAEKETTNIIPKIPQVVPVPPSSLLQGSNEDITAEGAALYLQQQESQLMVAMQLKAQEEKLVAMQMRQKESQRVQREAALAHHVQLDAMLRKQSENRQQMQAIIAAHQERITQRIKDLLSTQDVNKEDNNNINEDFVNPGKAEDKVTPHSRERKQLLQLVQSLQENHDKEIDLMESSYRRQLVFLEVSLNQSEERMKEESDKLVKFYTEKIGWLEEHHLLYKKMTEENLISLTDRHRAENEMLRQQHLDNVRALQEHHATLMENIKNAVKQEQVLIQDSAGFSNNLQELLTDIKENKSQCQLLVQKVQALSENTQRDTERNLQVRETQINELIQQLKKERDNFETEKTESRDIVKMLETRLKQMTTMIEEETSSLKQKKMEFEFEKATFDKKMEFAKNILKKQDEELKMLRDDFQKEYQDKISKIDEEKSKAIKDSAIVAKEKASVMSMKQELEKMKAELQAQLEEVSEERSKLNAEKQQMNMEEQRVLAKSRDLDLLAKTAIDKQSQADKKYSEAEFLQRKYEDRIRRIQEHVVSLNSREKQIAREKVALSRERLALHNERKQMENRQQCSLCKSAQNAPYSFEHTYMLPESYLNVPAPKDPRDMNVNSAMNAIEQEISHLMSRNFNLKHNPLISSLSDETRHANSTNANELPSPETMKMESGPFKEYMDPKFMMLRLDVQKVLSNLDQSKRDNFEDNAIEEE